MYVQRDARWASKKLGTSPWTMGDSGCYVTSVANVLSEAGYSDVTPGTVCDALNANGGFTPNGLASHAKITEAFPQLRYDASGTYKIVQLRLLDEYHYEAKLPGGELLDPWTGSDRPPFGFRPTGSYSAIACEPAPHRADVEEGPAALGETASYQVPIEFTVRAKVRVNWRSAPHLSAPVIATYSAGATVTCVDTVGGDLVGDTSMWFKSKAHGLYSSAYYNTHL